jgi:predicted secreted protein
MLSGLVSALLVLAGGACAVAGYVLGSWHQRRALEAEMTGEMFRERSVELIDDRSPHRDQRSN